MLLVDARESETPLSAGDIQDRMALFSSLADDGLSPRFAFVLRASPLLTLARQANARKDPDGMAIGLFADDAEALAWLESEATT